MDDVELQRYWSLQDIVTQPRQNISDIAAIEQTESILSAAVKRQMVADVPLGAFLSGGVDSSLIVALMQNQSIQPVHTFTIGFNETSFNEADHAAAVAAEEADHHPDILMHEYKLVTLRWRTHSENAITEKDHLLATRSDELSQI